MKPTPLHDIDAALRSLGLSGADTWADREVNGRIGRIGIVHGHQVEIYFPQPDGSVTLEGRVLTTDLNLRPVAGDWIAETAAVVTTVLPRRTCLSRPDPNGRDVQVLAANVDTVVIVSAVDLGLNVRALERLAVMAWESGATPVVVLTKADELSGAEDAESIAEQARTGVPGIEVLVTSAHRGTGLEPLRARLREGTTVMLGASGAGKTSLLNALEGRSEMVREVRRDGQGRHTTTTRRLYPLVGGGVLLDLPGIRALDLLAGDDAVNEAFSEIGALARRCRFADCAHDGDAGCAVEAAAMDGTLSAGRLESWRAIRAETAYQNRRNDPEAMADQRKRWKQVSKQARANGRQ